VLNTCANPDCSESFRYMRDGKLFRLQTEFRGSSSEISNPEYFWLCGRCADIMSLRLAEDGQVIVVDTPGNHLASPAQVDFVPLDRRGGLLLGCLRIVRASAPRAVPVPRRRAAYAS
jgi:hypothetical protein